MEILGVGPFEFLIILLIALIVLGPGDMVKAGRTIGRFMHKVVTSPEWRTVQKASHELRYLPNKLMREANLEDLSKDMSELNQIGSQLSGDFKKVEMDISSWTTPPDLSANNTILPQSEDPPPKKSNPTDAPEGPA